MAWPLWPSTDEADIRVKTNLPTADLCITTNLPTTDSLTIDGSKFESEKTPLADDIVDYVTADMFLFFFLRKA